MQVRVRYAPSPTGLQHIGGIRTALFNYLFARANGGSFVLRIEDTDQQRFRPEALEDVYDSLDWLGISEDESPRKPGHFGPYVQSEKRETYRTHALSLVENGHAYRCFCTPERLEQLREKQKADKSSVLGYDRFCRSLSPAQASARAESGEPFVIRLKTPLEGETSFEDRVLGTITRKNADINPDPVLLKADGYPTYHLANVIDDHEMEITHILRAQEWIPSGPIHVLLYRAFSWVPPQYVHLPMVMGSDGQKLSKRHGATSLQEFRSQGYLPEAIINYLALVGWSFDDKAELFSLSQLEERFNIDRLQKSPAVFDYAKLDWYNAHYMRELSDESLLAGIVQDLAGAGVMLSGEQRELVERALPLLRERLHNFSQTKELVSFLLSDNLNYDTGALLPKGLDATQTKHVLVKALELLEVQLKQHSTSEQLDFALRDLAETLGRKLGQVLMPLRIALTGTKNSPPLADIVILLGKQSCLTRINLALQALEEMETE